MVTICQFFKDEWCSSPSVAAALWTQFLQAETLACAPKPFKSYYQVPSERGSSLKRAVLGSGLRLSLHFAITVTSFVKVAEEKGGGGSNNIWIALR